MCHVTAHVTRVKMLWQIQIYLTSVRHDSNPAESPGHLSCSFSYFKSLVWPMLTHAIICERMWSFSRNQRYLDELIQFVCICLWISCVIH